MIYEVQKFVSAGVWEKESEHKDFDSAKKRAIELVGNLHYYAEPNHGDDWKLDEGFFGDRDMDKPWTCRIEITK